MRTMKHIIRFFALSGIRTIKDQLTIHMGLLAVDEMYGFPIFENIVLAEDGNLYRTGKFNVSLIPLKQQWEIDEIIWDW